MIPNCEGPGDASNFDKYREEEIKVSATERYAEEFADGCFLVYRR